MSINFNELIPRKDYQMKQLIVSVNFCGSSLNNLKLAIITILNGISIKSKK